MSLRLAMKFHEAYERLAPKFGYSTREEFREFNPESTNGKLMLAVCSEIEHDEAFRNIVEFGELQTALEEKAEAQRKLAEIIGYCAQEGHDGEPYDTINAIATGAYSTRGGGVGGVDDKAKRFDALRELQQESERMGLYDADRENGHDQ